MNRRDSSTTFEIADGIGPDKWELFLALAEPEGEIVNGERTRRTVGFGRPVEYGEGWNIQHVTVDSLSRGNEEENNSRDSMGLRFNIEGSLADLSGRESESRCTVSWDVATKMGQLTVHPQPN